MDDNIIECWKPIAETNGKYEVSNLGNVRNVNTGNIRKHGILPTGYHVIAYHIDGKNCRRYVHRLVAEAFCAFRNENNVVNHINNNRNDNRSINLEWATQLRNVHHGMKDKRYKLNAIPVIGYKDGFQYRFASAHYAKKITGCDDSGILKCCKGKQYSCKGYHWRFAEAI